MSHFKKHDLPLYKAGEELLFLHEDKIRFMQDVFFFIHHEAQRSIEPLLKKNSLGLAHFRLLQFVCHYPGISVGELCLMLGVTKQSLHRVLREMFDTQHIDYQFIAQDRRKKTLFPTEKGKLLEEKLFNLQREQFVRAFREASHNTYIEGFQRILYGMLSQSSRKLLEQQSFRKASGGKNNVDQ